MVQIELNTYMHTVLNTVGYDMLGKYINQAWFYFCDRLEFAVAFSIVQQFTVSKADSTWYVIRLLVVVFGVVALHANIFTQSNTTIVLILQLILAECFALTMPIMDANAEDDVVLLAHVAFYITLISTILSLVCAVAQAVPSCADFLHGISPYTILYAVGVCLPRLEQSRQLHTSIFVCVCYSAGRLDARSRYQNSTVANVTPNTAMWYLIHFLDYISDRIIMVGFRAQCIHLFGTYTLSICAAYVAVLILLSQTWAQQMPILQTYKTLAAMTLAQQAFVMMSVVPNIRFIVFAAAVLAPGIVCGDLTWYGQVAVIGFCISVMDMVDTLSTSVAPGFGDKIFVSMFLILIIGHLTPIPKYAARPVTKESFKTATIGLPEIPSSLPLQQ